MFKVYEGDDRKVVSIEYTVTDLYVDDNDSINGDPQQLVQLKLMDRVKLGAIRQKAEKIIANTPQSYPDNST